MLAKATFTTTTEPNPLKRLLSQVESIGYLETRAIEHIIEAREIRQTDSARYEELLILATQCLTKARIYQDREVKAAIKKITAPDPEPLKSPPEEIPEDLPTVAEFPSAEAHPRKRTFLRDHIEP